MNDLILVDFSQIAFASCTNYQRDTKEQVDIDLMRHIILNTLLTVKSKVTKGKSSDVVLCMDGRNYWRKQVFPFYKGNRKASREKDSFDWETFFKNFSIVKEEIKNNLPFTSVEVDTAEADDVIYVLSKLMAPHRQVIIVSSDKDLLQIQEKVPGVKQWSPIHGKYITLESRGHTMVEHLIKGDSGDGIPNIFSDDDTFVNPEKRQKPVKSSLVKKIEEIGIDKADQFCTCPADFERLKRNIILIDLEKVPSELQAKIVQEYKDFEKPQMKLYNYLTLNRLNKLLERASEFNA